MYLGCQFLEGKGEDYVADLSENGVQFFSLFPSFWKGIQKGDSPHCE